MAEYLFFPPADKAQDKIWNYTLERWGEQQAERYIQGLHQYLQELADREKLWRKLPNSLIVPPDLNLQVYFSRYEHHYIFFRQLSENRIGVLSILHENVDMPVQLQADLTLLSD